MLTAVTCALAIKIVLPSPVLQLSPHYGHYWPLATRSWYFFRWLNTWASYWYQCRYAAPDDAMVSSRASQFDSDRFRMYDHVKMPMSVTVICSDALARGFPQISLSAISTYRWLKVARNKLVCSNHVKPNNGRLIGQCRAVQSSHVSCPFLKGHVYYKPQPYDGEATTWRRDDRCYWLRVKSKLDDSSFPGKASAFRK